MEYLISGPRSYQDFRETGPGAYKRQFTAAGKEKKDTLIESFYVTNLILD